jgi:hypothetical protein
MCFTFHNQPDNINYEKLAFEFCRFYYNMFDNDFPSLQNIYVKTSYITFRNEKFGTFVDLKWKVYDNKIWSFTHHEIHGNAQPVENDAVLISTYGIISANRSLTKHKFNEILLLQKDNCNGRYYIQNSVFNLID